MRKEGDYMKKIDFKAMMHIMACHDRLSELEYNKLRAMVLDGKEDDAMQELRRLMQHGR